MNLNLKVCLNFHICFATSVLWSFSSQEKFTGNRVRGGLGRWIYSPDEISGKAPCDSIRARTPPKGLCLSRFLLTSHTLLEVSNKENFGALGFFCSRAVCTSTASVRAAARVLCPTCSLSSPISACRKKPAGSLSYLKTTCELYKLGR